MERDFEIAWDPNCLFYGGFNRLKQFKGLVLSNKTVKDILGLIWCANIMELFDQGVKVLFPL